MSDESTNHNLLIGVALAAGVIGAVTSFLRSNHLIGESIIHPTKKISKCCLGVKAPINKNFLIGGIAGGLIGATAALMLAPKSGSGLVQNVAQKLDNSDGTEKTQAIDEMIQKKMRTKKANHVSKNIQVTEKNKLSAKKRASSKVKAAFEKNEPSNGEAPPKSLLP